MENDKALTLRQQQLIAEMPTPTEVISMAAEQARALMDIVERQELYKEIQGKKYLEVEAWETIGAFNNIGAVTEWVTPIKEGDQIIGYEAKVNLVKNDEIISSGIMSCGLDEFPCQGKTGMAKHKAAKSAAQTWAESKAYRMKYAYIAKLAGYQATPAEEMISETQQCPIHDAPMKKFTKGRSIWYAHKLPDGKWCNGQQKTAEEPAPTNDTAPSEKTPVEAPQGEIDWASKTGKEFNDELLREVLAHNWTNEQAGQWLVMNFNVANSKAIKLGQRNEVLKKLHDEPIVLNL